jgi:hypothetical protein
MRNLAFVAVGLASVTSLLRAQALPNFEGSWRLTPGSVRHERVLEANERGSMSSPMGEIRITQRGGLITLTGGHLTSVYRLDGTPTTVKAKLADGTLLPATGRAHWEGGRLYLSFGLEAGNLKRQETTILSFDGNGNLQLAHTGGGAGTNLSVSALFTRDGSVVPLFGPHLLPSSCELRCCEGSGSPHHELPSTITMRFLYVSHRAFVLAVALGSAGSIRASAQATTRPVPTRFQKNIDAFLRADSVSAPAAGGIEFVGSSIIRLWSTLGAQMAPLPAYNRGFGGSQTHDVLYYMDHIVLPYRPRFVVYYCGSNDVTAGETADSIVSRIEQFHQRLERELPSTRMFFLSVLHAPEKRTKWAVVDSVNARIRRYAATAKNIEYVDINPPLLDASGDVRGALYLPDSLHYVPSAYVLFTNVVKPVLERAWSTP